MAAVLCVLINVSEFEILPLSFDLCPDFGGFLWVAAIQARRDFLAQIDEKQIHSCSVELLKA